VIGETWQADTDRAVRAMITAPELPRAPEPKSSVWSAPLRAIPAAAAEMGAGLGEIIKGYGEVAGSLGDSGGGMFAAQDAREREEAEAARRAIQERGVRGRNQVSDALRDVSEGYRPDPATASTAENIVFALSKGAVKFGAYFASGPALPLAFGIDEGLTATDDLQRKGVDDVTATNVGVLTGAATAAGFALPIAGSTVGKTAALYAVGGPGAFVAQQAATREILREADYGAIGEQYDPLDPAGLAVATLLPAAFAGMHVRSLTRAPKVASEAVDAAMTHNLTLQQDVRAHAPEPVLPLVPPVRDGTQRVDDVAPPKVEADAQLQAARERVKQLVEAEDAPDIVVRLTEDGKPVTAKQELEAIRRQIEEGTDAELGTLDADLLKVAANCALSAAL